MRSVNNIDLNRLGISAGQRVLDLGCARGEQTIALAQQGLRVTGADTDAALLEVLKENAAAAGVQCETVRIDVRDGLPEHGTFDAVVCTEVLEHIPDYRVGMSEIVAALKPGGRACISVPTARTELIFHRLHPQYVHDSTHVNVFTRRLLIEELQRAGLIIDHVEGRNFEWTVFWLLHGAAHTRFDHTGTPVENERLTTKWWRGRHVLQRLHTERAVIAAGNRLLPKSVYVYGHKAA